MEARICKKRARLESELSPADPETRPILEGILGRQRWNVTHIKGRDTDS